MKKYLFFGGCAALCLVLAPYRLALGAPPSPSQSTAMAASSQAAPHGSIEQLCEDLKNLLALAKGVPDASRSYFSNALLAPHAQAVRHWIISWNGDPQALVAFARFLADSVPDWPQWDSHRGLGEVLDALLGRALILSRLNAETGGKGSSQATAILASVNQSLSEMVVFTRRHLPAVTRSIDMRPGVEEQILELFKRSSTSDPQSLALAAALAQFLTKLDHLPRGLYLELASHFIGMRLKEDWDALVLNRFQLEIAFAILVHAHGAYPQFKSMAQKLSSNGDSSRIFTHPPDLVAAVLAQNDVLRVATRSEYQKQAPQLRNLARQMLLEACQNGQVELPLSVRLDLAWGEFRAACGELLKAGHMLRE